MGGQLVPIPFGMQTAEARSGAVGIERLRNWYPEQSPTRAKGPVALYPTPGLKLWATVGSGPIRGLETMQSDVYAVSGEELYAIDSVGSSDLLGSVPGVGKCHTTNNGTHVAICSSAKAFAANRTELVVLPEEYLNGATYMDGYGIFTQSGTQTFWITGSDDMTTISGADRSEADRLTGNVKGCIADHGELWILKERDTEVYRNTGNADFPFERVAEFERGCASALSVAKGRNTVIWLGDDRIVYRAQGYQPVPITTPAVQRIIDDASDPDSAAGWVYEQNGHTFYVLTFSDLTLVYDMDAGVWHDRKTDGLNNWRVGSFSGLGEKLLVGDIVNGNIYELDLDTYDENGSTIIREATSPPLWFNGSRFVVHELYVDFEPGVGLTSGQGSDPKAILEWSDNGGKTWSNRLLADIGKKGEYGVRATWNRLGYSRQRTFKLTVSDPVKAIVTGAYARIEVAGS